MPTNMSKTMTKFWMDSKIPDDSRWHSRHEGDFITDDRLADHFVGKLRDECRGETSEVAIMVRFTRILKELLDSYESQANLLLKLADTGRVTTLLHQYIDNALDMLNILDQEEREVWHSKLLQERQERLKVFEAFVKDEEQLLAAFGNKNQQLEIVTLLRYCVKKYHDGLTPFAGADEKYRDKLTEGELDTLAMVYELVVRKTNVVSGKPPEWFFTSDHEWAWVNKAKVEDSKGAWDSKARAKYTDGNASDQVRGEISEEVCVRLASIWTELNHPHLRKFYGASHVGKPFVIHETCFSPSYEMDLWRYAANCARGLQYAHDRGLAYHDVSPSTFLCSYSERRGVVDGLGLVPRSEADRSFRDTNPAESPVTHNVLRFGISVFFLLVRSRNSNQPSDKRDETFDSWKPESTKSLPDDRPQFITEDEWRVLLGLCNPSPASRTKLADAGFISLIPDENGERQTSAVEDVSKYFEKDCTVGGETLAEVMRGIKNKCRQAAGLDAEKNERVCNRLHDVYTQLLNLSEPVPSGLLDEFCGLARAFRKTADKDCLDCSRSNLKISKTTGNMNSRFHYRIDHLVRSSPLLNKRNAWHQWQPTWQQARKEQFTLFQSCLNNPEQFLDEIPSNQLTQALTTMRFEAHSRSGAYSPEDVEKIKVVLAAKKIPTLQGAKVGEALPKWFVPGYQIELGKHISDGGFGTVYHGKWFGTDVVVKLDISPVITPEKRAKFRQEADLWFTLNHSNLIKLYAACYEGQPFFVCERATRGILPTYLKSRRHETWFRLLQAALGLQHLHEHNIVHGDLKGNNILVCEGGATKIADFGLSILAYTSEDKTLMTAAVQWMAPECLKGKPPTYASDIYAFGMCIIEAVTGEHPWGMLDNKTVTHKAEKGELPTRSEKFQTEEWDLIERMCRRDPTQRIGIGAVVKILEDIGVRNLLERSGMMVGATKVDRKNAT
ncbi:Serine/threonine/tyrosine-protein kinase HT1 [Phytophthora ramorum]|nr:Serine/threonine/tyrosine-protein kinase HT1 [Phytophthora ramorum]